MKKLMIAALALAPLAFASGAEAQGTARGAQRGVEDGSAAAGPVGGVVGGAVGAATGTVGGVLGTDTDPARRAREDARSARGASGPPGAHGPLSEPETGRSPQAAGLSRRIVSCARR